MRRIYLNKKILRYLGGVAVLAIGGFFLYVLFHQMLYMPTTTDFSKIMKIIDIILICTISSICIGVGIACFKEELSNNIKSQSNSGIRNNE